jgi:hypothetical protein
MLAKMLGESAEMGVTMYLSLNSFAAQGHILNGIADAKLSGETRATFRDLWTEQRTRGEERHRLIHGQWGYDPARSDFIALAERDYIPRTNASILGRPQTSPQEPIPLRKAVVYVERDFEAIEGRIIDFRRRQGALLVRLLVGEPFVDSTRAFLQSLPPRSTASDPENLIRTSVEALLATVLSGSPQP